LTKRQWVLPLFADSIFPTSGKRRLNQGHSRTLERQFDLKEQQRRLVDDESRAKAEIAEGERAYAFPFSVPLTSIFTPLRLKQLGDVTHRKLQTLAQFDPDCVAVINWLRSNQHRFRMEIIEPAVISLTVPNKSYVHAVEACFNITQLKVRLSSPFQKKIYCSFVA
jgi:hypothetical protein